MPPTGLSRTSIATRARILDVATEVFSAVGFRAASLRDIAARAGLTHPALIYHFPSKADLLTAVLASRDVEDLERFPLPEQPTVSDHAERLLAVVEYNRSQPELIQLYTILAAEATAAEHPARPWLERRFERVHQMSALMWADTALSADEIEAEIVSLYALIDGIQIRWLLNPGGIDMTALVRNYLIRIGLLPRLPAR